MRRLWIPLLVALLASFCLAAHEEPLESLKARAEAAKPKDQDRLFAEMARREVEEANTFYIAGQIDKAQASLQEVVAYAEKAQQAAQKSGKKLKETEIILRKATRRLETLRGTFALEDRPPVQAAIDRLEEIRKSLLDQMFSKPKPKEKPKEKS